MAHSAFFFSSYWLAWLRCRRCSSSPLMPLTFLQNATRRCTRCCTRRLHSRISVTLLHNLYQTPRREGLGRRKTIEKREVVRAHSRIGIPFCQRLKGVSLARGVDPQVVRLHGKNPRVGKLIEGSNRRLDR